MFSIGTVFATEDALKALAKVDISLQQALHIHQCGGWPVLTYQDLEMDEENFKHGWKASKCSAYRDDVWIVTDPHRKLTTVHLPGE